MTLKATDPRGLIGSDGDQGRDRPFHPDGLRLRRRRLHEEQGDRDDNDDKCHLDADEIENGIDDDCDDLVDEGTQRVSTTTATAIPVSRATVTTTTETSARWLTRSPRRRRSRLR